MGERIPRWEEFADPLQPFGVVVSDGDAVAVVRLRWTVPAAGPAL